MYEPETFWEKRLRRSFNLRGVGHATFSEFYNWWLYRAKITALEKGFASCGVSLHGRRAADVGCGTGFFVNWLQTKGAQEIVGMDITPVAVEECQKKFPKHTFLQVDIGEAHVPTHECDVVLALDVLYHIVDDVRWRRALANIRKQCTAGAHVFIIDRFGQNTEQAAPHVRFRSLAVYQEASEGSGLRMLDLFPVYVTLGRPFPPIYRPGRLARVICRIDGFAVPALYLLDKVIARVLPCVASARLLVARAV